MEHGGIPASSVPRRSTANSRRARAKTAALEGTNAAHPRALVQELAHVPPSRVERSPAPLPHTSASTPALQSVIFAHLGTGVLGDQAEPSQWSTASSAQICGGDRQLDWTACGSIWHERVPTAHT